MISEIETTCITCTGDRPEAFALLKQWMINQVVEPDQWIVVDDGQIPLEDTEGFEYYRREPQPNDYKHTLCLNLALALTKVKYSKIIIMEDDDWYSPIYIDYMSNLLEKTDLVGLGNLIFYYPSLKKYMEKGTVKQPALAQTAFKKEMIPILQDICKKALNIPDLHNKGLVDTVLWKYPIDKSKKMIVYCDKYLTMGMKGMPGRIGLTTHHNKTNAKYKDDVDCKLLKSIINKDFDLYSKIIC